MTTLHVQMIHVDKLIPYEFNNKIHPQHQIDKIANSIAECGFKAPILVDENFIILAGHGRLLGAKKLGMTEVPVLQYTDLDEIKKKKYRILDNRLGDLAEYDLENLKIELDAIGDDDLTSMFDDYDLGDLNKDGDWTTGGGEIGSLAERFIMPPFSILDRRSGPWQERKNDWLALGIQSELGREENLIGGGLRELSGKVGMDNAGLGKTGTSVFDPVLAELAYRWFCLPRGSILDPFAGGSVRGIVAGKLGYYYHGCDLSETQVSANKEQIHIVSESRGEPMPLRRVGDSQEIRTIYDGLEADMIFSCPPYADLEVYSDDPRDISNMEYEEFLVAYDKIIEESLAMLKNNRFAVFVVGEVRGKDGGYYDFLSDTKRIFQKHGATFYNDIVIVDPQATLPFRITKQFNSYRKIGKHHQNMLVFFKGDRHTIKSEYGEVILAEESEEPLLNELSDVT